MNKEQRATLRKLAEGATPGPWVCKPHTCETIDDIDPSDDWTVYGANGQCVCFESIGRNKRAQQNAKHIAAANPSTILQLLDYIGTLEKDAARYRWFGKYWINLGPCAAITAIHEAETMKELDAAIDAALQGETE